MVRKSDKNVIVSGKGPIMSVGIGLCFSLAIAFNALSRQDARHPAPFEGFWTLETRVNNTTALPLKPRQRRAAPSDVKPSKLTSDIQSELAKMGYYDGALDGLIGPNTHSAIMRYQRENGLTGNGRATTGLLEHIKFNQRIRDAIKQSPVSKLPKTATQIQKVQAGLADLGYAPGPIDGVMGEQTVQAIRSFERDHRLKVTGKVTEALLKELGQTTGLSSRTASNGNS